MIKTCEFCNKEYEAKREAQRACSRQCNAKINVRDGIARLPRTKTKIFVCPKCGKEFERLLSTVKIEQPYCSRSCSKLGRPSLRDRRVPRVCIGCGKEFLVKRSRVSKGRGQYCSQACKPPLSPQAARTHGDSYHRFYGMWKFSAIRAKRTRCINSLTIEQIEAQLQIQNGKCAYCSAELSQPSLDHKVPFHRGGNNVIENVHLVCLACNGEKRGFTDEEYRAVLEVRSQKAAREERSA